MHLYRRTSLVRIMTLPWRHNELAGVSNHQHHDCLLNCLSTRRSKKTSKFRVTGLCVGNSLGTGEFPAQRASNAENVSIWWRHHDMPAYLCRTFTSTNAGFLIGPFGKISLKYEFRYNYSAHTKMYLKGLCNMWIVLFQPRYVKFSECFYDEYHTIVCTMNNLPSFVYVTCSP